MQSRIIHMGDNFVVVSKPPGIPVVPCVCNILESCLTCAAQVSINYCLQLLPSILYEATLYCRGEAIMAQSRSCHCRP